MFEAIALGAVVLTQYDVWTNIEDDRIRYAGIVLVAAGALVFRRRAPFAAPLVLAAGAIAFSLLDPSGAYNTDTMFLPLILAGWAAGALTDRRQAITAFAAVLVAGWTVFIRAPGRPVDGADLAQLPAHGHLRDLGRGDQAFGARADRARSGRAGPRRRHARPSPRSAAGSRASCTTSSPTRSA